MSKETIKNLTASELVCFVCLETIESLAELNDVYKNNLSLYSKDMERLQKAVNHEVVWMKGESNKFWLMRHTDCDPFKRKKFTVEDL